MAKTLHATLLGRLAFLSMFMFVCAAKSSALVAPSATPLPPTKESKVINAFAGMTPQEFVKLKPKQFREITGEKLSIPQKISLKLAQKKVKQALKNNEAVDDKVMATAVDTSDFNLGGFILGLLLWVVGLLIAYIIGDSTTIKWAWIGFGISTLIWFLAIIL